MRLWGLAATALVLGSGIAAPAFAQHRTLEVAPSATWQHAQTGLTLPPVLAGLRRGEVADSSSAELDMMVQFGEMSDTWATVYVFRPAGGSLPIWYDRAETQILLRGDFRGVVPLAPPTAFAGPRQPAASGLRRMFRTEGQMKGTGLAALPLGGWLVVVRITSVKLDAPALDTRLDEVIAAIGWPDKVVEAPAVSAVPACTVELAYPKRAKLKKPDMADSFAGALIASAASGIDRKADPAKPVTWCREGKPTTMYGVYRNSSTQDPGYLMAVGDAGSTIGVWPGIALDGKDKGQRYAIGLGLLDRTMIYPSFDALPRPQQAFDLVRTSRPVSSVSRSGKNVNVTIAPGT